MNLKSLIIRSCKSITDLDLKPLADFYKLVVLNLKGSSEVTAACLDYLTERSFHFSEVTKCHLSYDGCEKFSALSSLKDLNLGFNNISDTYLGQLKGFSNLKALEPSDTEVKSNGILHLSGLTKLQDINLFFTSITNNDLKKLSGLTSLRSLNLDACQITDSGLAVITNF